MDKPLKPIKMKSADMQESIEYEVRREMVNRQISRKVAEIYKDGLDTIPTEEDIAELRRLAASR